MILSLKNFYSQANGEWLVALAGYKAHKIHWRVIIFW